MTAVLAFLGCVYLMQTADEFINKMWPKEKEHGQGRDC